jgi:hypothetical protein
MWLASRCLPGPRCRLISAASSVPPCIAQKGPFDTRKGTCTTVDEEAEIQAPATSHVDGVLDNQVEVLFLPLSSCVKPSGLEEA